MGEGLQVMSLRLLLLFGAVVVAGCTEARLDGSVALGRAPPLVVANEIVLLPETPDRIRAELVALGRSGTFTKVAEARGYTTWRASDGSALVTQDGVVTSTYRLGFDLISADVSDTLSLVRARRSGDALRIHQYLDGEDQIKTRAFQCTVALDRSNASSYRMTEDCRGVSVSFVNTFTIGKDGAVISSRQWLGPDVGYLRLTGVPINGSVGVNSN